MTEDRNLVGTEVLTWRETVDGGDKVWVAAWARRDVVAQGPTEQEAVRRLTMTIAITWMLQEADGGEPPPLVPEKRLQRWRRLHDEEHGEQVH